MSKKQNAESIVRNAKRADRKFKQPIASIDGSPMFLPNHSGDHSKGRVLTTPTTDYEIANKAYVDASTGVTDHDLLTNVTSDQHHSKLNLISNVAQVRSVDGWRIFYADGSNTINEMSLGNVGTYLSGNGVSTSPSWQTTASIDHDTLTNWVSTKHFDTSTLTSGSIPFSNGTTFLQDNANLFWDDTNNFLKVNRIELTGGDSVDSSIKGAFGNMMVSRDEWLRFNDNDGGGNYHTSGIFMDGVGVSVIEKLIVGTATFSKAPTTGIYTQGGIIDNTLTSGSVLFADSNKQIQEDNAKLYWDDTNNKLGIGMNAPSRTLEVSSPEFVLAQFKGTGTAGGVIAVDTAGINQDSGLRFSENGVLRFVMGLHGDTDTFSIASTALGTNDKMTINSIGDAVFKKKLDVVQDLTAATIKADDGYTGTWVNAEGKTVTVTGGIITSVV